MEIEVEECFVNDMKIPAGSQHLLQQRLETVEAPFVHRFNEDKPFGYEIPAAVNICLAVEIFAYNFDVFFSLLTFLQSLLNLNGFYLGLLKCLYQCIVS